MWSFPLIGVAVAGLLAGITIGLWSYGKRKTAEATVVDGKVREFKLEVERLNKEVDKGIFDILALYEFTTVMGSITNLTELYNMMVDTMLRIVRYDACAIFLVKPEADDLEIAVARGFTPEQYTTLQSTSINKGVVGRVIQSGQPELISDFDNCDVSDPIFEGSPFKSVLSIPFSIYGQVLGVLNLYLRNQGGFNQDDLRILFIIANQAAFAIQNGQLYEKVHEQATRDGLTGLYNHRVFREQIEMAVAEAQDQQGYVSMIMSDVDEFKSVNDRFGHQRGDDVLKEMAALISQSVRETDIVARYGGEEFAVILPRTPFSDALAVASRIHESVTKHDFNGLHITVSLGVATCPSDGINTTDELISAADEYAYVAKARGKNQIFYRVS